METGNEASLVRNLAYYLVQVFDDHNIIFSCLSRQHSLSLIADIAVLLVRYKGVYCISLFVHFVMIAISVPTKETFQLRKEELGLVEGRGGEGRGGGRGGEGRGGEGRGGEGRGGEGRGGEGRGGEGRGGEGRGGEGRGGEGREGRGGEGRGGEGRGGEGRGGEGRGGEERGGERSMYEYEQYQQLMLNFLII